MTITIEIDTSGITRQELRQVLLNATQKFMDHIVNRPGQPLVSPSPYSRLFDEQGHPCGTVTYE